MNTGKIKSIMSKTVKGTMQMLHSVREVSLGQRLQYALITTNQSYLIIDLEFQDISSVIIRNAYPRMGRLSPCERFAVVSFTDSTVYLYDTRTGAQISKIHGVPRGAANFLLSNDSSRLFFASNTTICLWNVGRSELELTSAQWRNINCYAINGNGGQIALGNYNGALIVLTIIGLHRVTEMELKKHHSCVMCIALENNKIYSVSYDKVFLTTTIENTNNGSKSITYTELLLQSVPRSIKTVAGIPHFFENQGLLWLVQGNKMRGYEQGLYTVTERKGEVWVMRYIQGKLQWFRR